MRGRFLSKISTILILMVAGGICVFPGAASGGTMDGTLQASSSLGPILPCGFAMNYTGTPGVGNWIDVDSASFQGSSASGASPCDLNEVSIVTDFEIYWGGYPTIANIQAFSLELPEMNCAYTLTGSMSIWSDWDSLGNWSGIKNATSSQFPCSAFPFQFTISDLLL